ncbi:MAG: 23S rRNA (pseudouridine(1915)-N(3))-methyltransferase RlmH [Clostridia bacterium]|nr:23S rRNA (pseudouridine(1915)-N(3))-methyltransferase RlmH [Clostridia bacterium]
MQKIYIVCVGRIKEGFYRDAVQEYLKRLTRFARVEIVEIPENRTLEKEGEAILRACKGHMIALCIEGRKVSSESFAADIKRLCDKGEDITFIIGSSCGLAQSVKDHADERISFSDMTFPHQLMRVILAEQIYRAFMINSGGEYHK